MPQLHPSQLLAEIEDAIRTAPRDFSLSEAVSWLGRATSLLKRWAPDRSIIIDSYARGSLGISDMLATSNFSSVLMLLHEARHDLRLSEVGPLSTVVATGATFDYFDEVRKLLVTSRTDLFFVDPYLNADFVARYFPHIPSGVNVRLLGRKEVPALLTAVDLAAQQYRIGVSVRSSNSIHDRFVFLDSARGFNSGASFKDGARLSPTIFTEITDALPAIQATYENLWSAATAHR
jgi:hypothetical protein